jgi:hypothetical protein
VFEALSCEADHCKLSSNYLVFLFGLAKGVMGMAPDDTMTERDFYTAVRSSADKAWGDRPAEADLSVDGLSGSILARLMRLFGGGKG